MEQGAARLMHAKAAGGANGAHGAAAGDRWELHVDAAASAPGGASTRWVRGVAGAVAETAARRALRAGVLGPDVLTRLCAVAACRAAASSAAEGAAEGAASPLGSPQAAQRPLSSPTAPPQRSPQAAPFSPHQGAPRAPLSCLPLELILLSELPCEGAAARRGGAAALEALQRG
eukprot:4164858-Prymnesium_polylepis.1